MVRPMQPRPCQSPRYIYACKGRQGQSCRLLCPWGQGHQGFKNPRLFKDRPADGKRSGCAAALLSVSQWAAPCSPAHVNLHAIYTHARVARVSLANCFALGAKGTGGLKTPGYPKTVLRTENAAAAPHPFLNISVFHSADFRMQIPDYFASRSGMVLRIILLSLWSIIPQPQSARNIRPPRHAHPKNRIKFMGSKCSPIRRTVSQSRNIPSTKNSHKSHATYAAPSEGRSLNSRGFLNPRILA